MKTIIACLVLVLAGLAASNVAAQTSGADIPRVPAPEPTPAPAPTAGIDAPSAQMTVHDALVAAAIVVFGMTVSWALAMIAFTSMIKSRQDPAAAYWQCIGALLFGTWITVFVAGSGLVLEGIWRVNWWIWGFYLGVGVVVAIFVSRLGRHARTVAGAHS